MANLLDPAPSGAGITTVDDTFCPQRDETAYRLSSNAMVEQSVATSFPSGFPNDFAVLVTARPQSSSNAFILTMHSAVGRLRIGVEIGSNPKFIYVDKNNSPGRENSPMFNGTSMPQGEWTRFAYAVRGQQIVLYMECQPVRTMRLDREEDADLGNDGVFLVGRELGASSTYQVGNLSK